MAEIVAVHHVKSHRSLAAIDAEDPVAVSRYWGNYHADIFAKRGASMIGHAVDHLEVQAYGDAFRAARLACTRIAKVMALFSGFRQLTKGVPFIRPTPKPKVAAPRAGHSMLWNGFSWGCIKCGVRSRNKIGPAFRCTEFQPLLHEFVSDARGHKLWVSSYSQDIPLVFCFDCGCYSSFRGDGLRKLCRGIPSHMGKAVLRRIKVRRHPIYDAPVSKPALLPEQPFQISSCTHGSALIL